ncbi:MAG: WGR domain-containing protein [Xanthomonadales bacterium]|nr:WGR domain-containing protein [Xanthomonadales bacterium]
MKREFYLQDDQSNKFWTIEVQGPAVITTNGRVGSKPRETRKHYPSQSVAEAVVEGHRGHPHSQRHA